MLRETRKRGLKNLMEDVNRMFLSFRNHRGITLFFFYWMKVRREDSHSHVLAEQIRSVSYTRITWLLACERLKVNPQIIIIQGCSSPQLYGASLRLLFFGFIAHKFSYFSTLISIVSSLSMQLCSGWKPWKPTVRYLATTDWQACS